MEIKIGDWNSFEKWNLLFWWKRLLDRNIFTQWLYMIFPFWATTVIFILMQLDNVLIMGEDEFSFFMDTSNSVCMTFLFVLAYFLGDKYPKWIKNSVNSIVKYETNNTLKGVLDKVSLITHCFLLLCFLGATAGVPFALVAYKQNTGWLGHISTHTNIVYNIYLGIVWYTSFCLLIYVLSGTYLIIKILPCLRTYIEKTEVKTIDFYNELKQNLLQVAKCISTTVSYAVFYVIGAFIIITNDYINNTRYEVEMTFYKKPIAAIILVFLVIAGFMFVILAAIKYMKIVGEIKCFLLPKITGKEKKVIESLSTSVFKSTFSKIGLVLSFIVPVLTLIFQIISDFGT